VYDERIQAKRESDETLTIHLRSDASGTTHEEAAQATDSRGRRYAARFGRFWSPAYRNLIDHPTILPIITELLADPAWGHCPPQVPEALRSRIRLDHDNVHYEPPAADGQAPLRIEQNDGRITGANALHGGPGNWHITCAYELVDVPAGGGGFGACPGSHTPAGWERLSSMGGVEGEAWRTQWVDSKWSRKHPGWDDETGVPVHRVEGKAGDCILFTEKMTQ
jgi:hypothetical protein